MTNSLKDLRKKIWDDLEEGKQLLSRHPPYKLIPNFKGSEAIQKKLVKIPEIKNAKCIVSDADRPILHSIFKLLNMNKTVYCIASGMKSSILNKVDFTPAMQSIEPNQKRIYRRLKMNLLTRQEVTDFKDIHVDVYIASSIAVSLEGYRVGRDEEFHSLEYKILSSLGIVDENTLIVTLVNDIQIVNPSNIENTSLFVPVQLIVTPNAVHNCTPDNSILADHRSGINWHNIDCQFLSKIPFLKTLRALDDKNGKEISLKKSIEKVKETENTISNITTSISASSEIQSNSSKEKSSTSEENSNVNSTEGSNSLINESSNSAESEKSVSVENCTTNALNDLKIFNNITKVDSCKNVATFSSIVENAVEKQSSRSAVISRLVKATNSEGNVSRRFYLPPSHQQQANTASQARKPPISRSFNNPTQKDQNQNVQKQYATHYENAPRSGDWHQPQIVYQPPVQPKTNYYNPIQQLQQQLAQPQHIQPNAYPTSQPATTNSDQPENLLAVYIGGLTSGLRGWELRRLIKDHGVRPSSVFRPPFVSYAFLHFRTAGEAWHAAEVLQCLRSVDPEIRVEITRRCASNVEPLYTDNYQLPMNAGYAAMSGMVS